VERGVWRRGLYLTWSERLAESAEAMLGFLKPVGSTLKVSSTLHFFAELAGEAWVERFERATLNAQLGRGEALLRR
jgi:hypothetical protein